MQWNIHSRLVILAASPETRWLQTSMFCLLVFVWSRTSVPCRRHTSGLQRSSAAATLFQRQIGDRSFAVAGPRVWNSLLAHLRDDDITYNSFRRELKTFCFNVASGVQWNLLIALYKYPYLLRPTTLSGHSKVNKLSSISIVLQALRSLEDAAQSIP